MSTNKSSSFYRALAAHDHLTHVSPIRLKNSTFRQTGLLQKIKII